MPVDKNCQPSRSSVHKKKKVSSAPGYKGGHPAEKRLAASLPPEISSSSLLPHPDSVQTQDQLPHLGATGYSAALSSGQKIKKHHTDSQTLHQTCENQALALMMDKLSVQNRESLRWEGVLQDPQEEAKRLELYRANRRQRYIARRERLDKET